MLTQCTPWNRTIFWTLRLMRKNLHELILCLVSLLYAFTARVNVIVLCSCQCGLQLIPSTMHVACMDWWWSWCNVMHVGKWSLWPESDHIISVFHPEDFRQVLVWYSQPTVLFSLGCGVGTKWQPAYARLVHFSNQQEWEPMTKWRTDNCVGLYVHIQYQCQSSMFIHF